MTRRPKSSAGAPRPHRMVPRPADKPAAAPWWKRVLRKPVTWVVAIVIAALAAYFSDYLKAFFNSVAPVDEAEQASGRAPIAVVDVHPIDKGVNYLVPGGDVSWWDRTAHQLPAQEVRDQHGVIPLDTAKWEITLEGQRTREVVITNMTPRLAEPCRQPLGGSMISNPDAGQGSKFLFKTTVDQPNPVTLGSPPRARPNRISTPGPSSCPRARRTSSTSARPPPGSTAGGLWTSSTWPTGSVTT